MASSLRPAGDAACGALDELGSFGEAESGGGAEEEDRGCGEEEGGEVHSCGGWGVKGGMR